MYLRERQDCPAGVQFYTCDEGFTGCCSVDACAFGGCPDEVHQINVRTLTLLSQPTTSRSVLSLPAETTSSSATYTILGYYTIPPTPTPTAEGTNNAATSSSSKSSSKTPIIVGATIGGIAFLALVAFLAWFFFRRWRGRQRYAGSRGTTPMLGNHGDEKFGTRETPDSGALRDSVGGLFTPFGGYRQAPMDDEPLRAARDSMEIEEGGTLDVSVPNEEKRALVPPPDDEHPAYHPLPGKHLPAYVPGQPAYNSLPSQRSLAPPSISHVPEQSPKIPGLVFTPIDISLGDAQLETIPITPKAELAASPVQPKAASPIPSSKFSTARRSPPPSSPPKNSPPADPAPLAKVATIRSPPRENGPLTNFSMKHISSPRPGYPSPTAGGKVELPASVPPTDTPVVSDAPVKAPLNPTPAFHHIYLPEPLSGISTSSMDTAYSTIPIGLGDDKSGSSTRSTNEPKQPKSSNLRHEHKRSPQTKQEKRSPPQAGHERKPSQQYTREEGSPPQPAQGKKRSPHTTREPRSSPPPKQQQEFTPPLPSGLSDTHPALRDQVRQNRGDTTPSKQGKQSPPTQQTQSPSQQERKSPPPLRQQRSDVSAMSDSYYPLREQPSELSMLTVSEESESAPVKSKKKKKWSASERDGMSLLVYKGDALIGQDEVSPLFSPQGVARRVAQSSEESDMRIQPLALQGREGWSAVPLTPMTPLNKTKAQKRADGMF